MYAAAAGDAESARALLDRGAAVNAMNVDGKTALMAAAARGHVETVRLLLDHGAAVDTTNIHGRTALTYAEETGHTDVARMLRERMPGGRTEGSFQSQGQLGELPRRAQ
jgi:ankyrin repeat protein